MQSANVAPTDRVRVLLAPDGQRVLRRHVWGLIPPWSKGREGAARMINARVETVAEKPSYRRAVRTSRCLLPADAWYEWQVGEQGRVPHLVKRADGGPLWLAGLWSRWHPPDGGPPVASACGADRPGAAGADLAARAGAAGRPGSVHGRVARQRRRAIPRGVLDTLASVGYPPLEWYRVGRGIGQVRDKGAHLMLPAPEPAIDVAPQEPAVLF